MWIPSTEAAILDNESDSCCSRTCRRKYSYCQETKIAKNISHNRRPIAMKAFTELDKSPLKNCCCSFSNGSHSYLQWTSMTRFWSIDSLPTTTTEQRRRNYFSHSNRMSSNAFFLQLVLTILMVCSAIATALNEGGQRPAMFLDGNLGEHENSIWYPSGKSWPRESHQRHYSNATWRTQATTSNKTKPVGGDSIFLHLVKRFSTGNELWDGIIQDCYGRPSFTCFQKNVYTYLNDVLDARDFNISQTLQFYQNQNVYQQTAAKKQDNNNNNNDKNKSKLQEEDQNSMANEIPATLEDSSPRSMPADRGKEKAFISICL